MALRLDLFVFKVQFTETQESSLVDMEEILSYNVIKKTKEHYVMSKYAEQILSVIKCLKADILERLDSEEEVAVDEVDELILEAIKKTAREFDVEDSTIRAVCTRELDLTSKEFYEMVKNYLVGLNNDLEDRVASYSKFTDSPINLKEAIKKIR